MNTEINATKTETVVDQNKAETVVDQKKAEAAKKRAETLKIKKEAKERVRKFAEGVKDEQLRADLMLLVSASEKKPRTANAGPSVNQQIKDMLIEKKELSELDIFKNFKIGRPEMNIKRRLFVKDCEPKDRVWFSFDEDKEVYKLVATGEKAPSGWDGYDPDKTAEL